MRENENPPSGQQNGGTAIRTKAEGAQGTLGKVEQQAVICRRGLTEALGGLPRRRQTQRPHGPAADLCCASVGGSSAEASRAAGQAVCRLLAFSLLSNSFGISLDSRGEPHAKRLPPDGW